MPAVLFLVLMTVSALLLSRCNVGPQAFTLHRARGGRGSDSPSASRAGKVYSGDWGRAASEAELATELPTLYVYDHCPFCVRARMIFGLKGIPYKLAFLLNDDVVTPTKMIGKKVLPILEEGGEAMGESLDIVEKIDGLEPLLKPAASREDIKRWQQTNAMLIRKLTRPRVAGAILPEFATKASRETWVRNHQFSDGTPFEECMEATPSLLEDLNKQLPELDTMLDSDESVNSGGVSYDDITLFPQLRTMTLVKGLVWPEKLRAYLHHMADVSDVPLLEKMAC